MNKVIEQLISEAQEEVWGNSPHNGSPEFEGYTVDPELLVKLIIKKSSIPNRNRARQGRPELAVQGRYPY